MIAIDLFCHNLVRRVDEMSMLRCEARISGWTEPTRSVNTRDRPQNTIRSARRRAPHHGRAAENGRAAAPLVWHRYVSGQTVHRPAKRWHSGSDRPWCCPRGTGPASTSWCALSTLAAAGAIALALALDAGAALRDV